MNGAEYFQAQVPEPWTILGLELRPLSAGHIILLNRIESPFVTPSTECKPEDLSCAVFICSQKFEDALASLNDPNLGDVLHEWHTKLAEREEVDWSGKVQEFQKYLAEGSRGPDFTTQGDGGHVGDVPSVQLVKAFLISETTLTETEILNRPWRLSLWDVATIQCLRGKLQFVSGETIADAQEVGRRLAEAVKAGKIKCQR